MTKSLKPVPKIVFNPDFGADRSQRIAFHEAAHAVAHYVFGRETYDIKVHDKRGVTRVPQADDVFASVVATLAGEAFERSIGLKFEGSRGLESDIKRAEALLATQCSGSALDEACRVTEEAAIALVATERFQTLAFALSKVLAKEKYAGAKHIRRILEEADPERETHGVETHSERSRPRFQWRDHHIGPDHDAACVVCLANPDRARAAKAKARSAI